MYFFFSSISMFCGGGKRTSCNNGILKEDVIKDLKNNNLFCMYLANSVTVCLRNF